VKGASKHEPKNFYDISNRQLTLQRNLNLGELWLDEAASQPHNSLGIHPHAEACGLEFGHLQS
jgi:hypothetical protein